MIFEGLAAIAHPQYHPPLLFACGFLAALVACGLLTQIHSNRRMQELITGKPIPLQTSEMPLNLGYRRFREMLIRSARHVDFSVDDVIDLREDEIQST